MPTITESEHIKGVFFADLKSFEDERGRFTEIFRREWFPVREWKNIQSNRSDSMAGVLRGLHYHHRQVDYWFVMRGSIIASLVDLRRTSKTFKSTQTIELSDQSNLGLYIPNGVAHGFFAQTTATLMYIVDQYYDGGDEFGVLWNDPSLNLDWGISDPILSPRDRMNPLLEEIPKKDLPA